MKNCINLIVSIYCISVLNVHIAARRHARQSYITAGNYNRGGLRNLTKIHVKRNYFLQFHILAGNSYNGGNQVTNYGNNYGKLHILQ